jgi:hypothetical protein
MTVPPGLPEGPGEPEETVASVSQLYLGNILYSLELTALALDEQNKRADASFYRGIARKLAEAHGRANRPRGGTGESGQ